MKDLGFDPSVAPLERLRGLLLGGAVGDALGAPVEFMQRREILERFGPQGITRFSPAYGRMGAITDDTQMTLFTLEGLIRAYVRDSLKGICHPPSVIHHAYLRWYVTQGGQIHKELKPDGWLITVKDLWSRRAPGHTCLTALAESQSFGDLAENSSKGAGGIMRVAPIGLFSGRPYSDARDAAAVTHGHITGQVAAGWFAAWIGLAVSGLALDSAFLRAANLCHGEAPELDAALNQAFHLAQAGPADVVPKELGEGWIAEEAAAIALWCALTAPDPFEAVRLAVNIDGDSDTTGTLVGQLMGAVHGPGWIPREMLAQLELVDVMDTLARDAAAVVWNDAEIEGENGCWDCYPGW